MTNYAALESLTITDAAGTTTTMDKVIAGETPIIGSIVSATHNGAAVDLASTCLVHRDAHGDDWNQSLTDLTGDARLLLGSTPIPIVGITFDVPVDERAFFEV